MRKGLLVFALMLAVAISLHPIHADETSSAPAPSLVDWLTAWIANLVESGSADDEYGGYTVPGG